MLVSVLATSYHGYKDCGLIGHYHVILWIFCDSSVVLLRLKMSFCVSRFDSSISFSVQPLIANRLCARLISTRHRCCHHR
jgi:hypothetical protein